MANQYLEINGDMAGLIKKVLSDTKNLNIGMPILWQYGIELWGENKFICINPKSKFFNKIAKLVEK